VPNEIFLIISCSKTLSPEENSGGIKNISLKNKLVIKINKLRIKITLNKKSINGMYL
jgi:hypothetical protein